MPLTKNQAPSGNGGAATLDAVAHAFTPSSATSFRPPARPRSARKGEDARSNARTAAKQQQAAERIAGATTELTRGIAEATEAARLLQTSVQEIASGAEETSSACEESLAAVERITERIGVQRQASEQMRTLVTDLQDLSAHTRIGIGAMLVNVGSAADRQEASVTTISELEKQAEEIGEIVKTVARIADQTNLLALNAAIEAARARQHGKGFAVVADEVRTLAETSEKSATEIRTLIDDIRTAVTSVAEGIGKSAESSRAEVEKGREVNENLAQIRKDMLALLDGATEIAAAADQATAAVAVAQKGAQEIAAAAEQQSAACEESLQAVGQQTQALGQSETAADELAEVAEELRSSSDIAKSAEAAATSAEELSAAVEEISGAASQILTGVDQIRDGARTASTQAEAAAAGLGQIEAATELSRDQSKAATDRVEVIQQEVAKNKITVDGMITAIGSSAQAARDAVLQVAELEQISRRIDKIVDAISTVSIQTNMLAVNGSVESARAGEFGKGFAVVSTDIRNLARDSADNAEQIKDLVKAVQDRIVVVRADLDETSRLALAEVERAKETTTRLDTMTTSLAQVSESGEAVLASAGEIAHASGEAKTGIDQIATAAAEAEKLAEQAAGAASEQRHGTEELAEAIEEIAALADGLQSA
ncbi:MAG: methyl-accepting chemotaxis protein [Solirubrobacteraceae bacterium]